MKLINLETPHRHLEVVPIDVIRIPFGNALALKLFPLVTSWVAWEGDVRMI